MRIERFDESIIAQARSIVRISDIVDALLRYRPEADIDPIYKAYVYSARVHQGQLRVSGEPYLNHPLWVAYTLTQLNADVPTIVAGLLHDTVEDTWATLEDIDETFGPHIASLVDGVTKLSKLKYTSKEKHQADNFRKMFVAMAKDLRVILIKLADRLHNMRTLAFLPDEKRIKIAKETMDLYAPLAGRLGIQWIKSELEDLALRYLEPDAYTEIAAAVAERQRESKAYIDQVISEIRSLVRQVGIEADVSGRPKHVYSVYRKMQKRDVGIDQIYDLIAFRVLVDDVSQCYQVFGLVHNHWTPVPGRFKDFIAMPKANRYQSLHTTVIGPEGRPIEVQIRTRQMHVVAELGVAAHWAYKEGAPVDADEEAMFQWLRQLYSWHREMRDSREFVEAVRIDLFQDEVYVFTPAGDVIDLPTGSTPLDFAYKIHTEVGHHTSGAKVGGRIVPLDYTLQTGEIVEILTSAKQHPRRHWLKLVQTPSARQKIRSYLNRSEREQAMHLGRTLLAQILKEGGLKVEPRAWASRPDGKHVFAELGVRDLDALTRGIGYGKITQARVRQALGVGDEGQSGESARETGFLPTLERLWRRGSGTAQDTIIVDGMQGIQTTPAMCCKPLPGDDIKGYIRVGKGIRIHRADCPHILNANPDRLVAVAWGGAAADAYQTIQLSIVTTDTPGILAKVGKAISDQGVNIVETAFRTDDGGKAEGSVSVSVRDRQELDKVIRELRKIRGVAGVTRRR